MDMIRLGMMLMSLAALSSCTSYPQYVYPPSPNPPVAKTRACTGSDFGPPALQLSRFKAKLGDAVVVLASPQPIPNQLPNVDPTQGTYTVIDQSTCPKVKAIRIANGETVLGETNTSPYQFSLLLKAGEKGLPAGNTSNAGTSIDIVISAKAVYSDDQTSQNQSQYGQSSAFLTVDYPATP
jgi:hypothetical protein